WYEFLEFQAVGLLEPEEAERTLRALGRTAEHERGSDRWTAGGGRNGSAWGCAGGATGRRGRAGPAPTRRAGTDQQCEQRCHERGRANVPHETLPMAVARPHGWPGEDTSGLVIRLGTVPFTVVLPSATNRCDQTNSGWPGRDLGIGAGPIDDCRPLR